MTKAEQTRISIEASGIEDIFVFTGFIAVVIFFIINSDIFTVADIVIGSIFTLMILKSIYFMMVGFVTSLASIDVIEEDIKFKNSIDRVEAALGDLLVQETNKAIKRQK
jgi:hypothetical protein